jgi:hypothetical protein
MKDNPTNEFAVIFLSVFAGLAATIAVGALLLPVVKPIVEQSFNFYLFSSSPAGAWKDDLMLGVTLFSWLFLASLAGGFACSLVSKNRDIIHVLISSLVSIVLIFVISGSEVIRENHLWQSLLVLLGIPLGNLLGAWVGGSFKKRKKTVY